MKKRVTHYEVRERGEVGWHCVFSCSSLPKAEDFQKEPTCPPDTRLVRVDHITETFETVIEP